MMSKHLFPQYVCGTRGSLRTMHGGGSAPSCCAFTHRAPLTLCSATRHPRFLGEQPPTA